MFYWAYTYTLGVFFVIISTASAFANTGSVLPSNVFEYGFAGAGIVILATSHFLLLRQNERINQSSNTAIDRLADEIRELSIKLEGKIIGKH